MSTATPTLVAKFDTEVPVVAVNGKVRFRGVVNPVLLERLLLAESQNRVIRGQRRRCIRRSLSTADDNFVKTRSAS